MSDNPGKYGDLLTPEGKVDHKKMAEFIEDIGSHLRPPMHWNTRLYGGVDDLSLTIYFERSGSMVPYDQRGGGGQLKKVVNDLINHFPAGSKVEINIVNDGIYPYKHTVDSVMGPVVGYSAKYMTAQRPEGTLSNLLADILVWAAKDYGEEPVLGAPAT